MYAGLGATMLLRLALWYVRKCGIEIVTVPARIQGFLPLVQDLCAKEDEKKESGEWKRHQVYARLLKTFPSEDKKDLAFAIELAMRKDI